MTRGRLPIRFVPMIALLAACGARQPAPSVGAPEAPRVTVTASARGIALVPDAWPTPAPGVSGTVLADGVVDGPAFDTAPGVASPLDFVFAVDGDRPVSIAALVLWGVEGAAVRVDVFTHDATYPLVGSTWWEFRETATPRGAARVLLSSQPVVLALSEPVSLRRVWIAVEPELRGPALTEVSALDADGLAIATAAGARVVALERPVGASAAPTTNEETHP